jgi:hypothetical protein
MKIIYYAALAAIVGVSSAMPHKECRPVRLTIAVASEVDAARECGISVEEFRRLNKNLDKITPRKVVCCPKQRSQIDPHLWEKVTFGEESESPVLSNYSLSLVEESELLGSVDVAERVNRPEAPPYESENEYPSIPIKPNRYPEQPITHFKLYNKRTGKHEVRSFSDSEDDEIVFEKTEPPRDYEKSEEEKPDLHYDYESDENDIRVCGHESPNYPVKPNDFETNSEEDEAVDLPVNYPDYPPQLITLCKSYNKRTGKWEIRTVNEEEQESLYAPESPQKESRGRRFLLDQDQINDLVDSMAHKAAKETAAVVSKALKKMNRHDDPIDRQIEIDLDEVGYFVDGIAQKAAEKTAAIVSKALNKLSKTGYYELLL